MALAPQDDFLDGDPCQPPNLRALVPIYSQSTILVMGELVEARRLFACSSFRLMAELAGFIKRSIGLLVEWGLKFGGCVRNLPMLDISCIARLLCQHTVDDLEYPACERCRTCSPDFAGCRTCL